MNSFQSAPQVAVSGIVFSSVLRLSLWERAATDGCCAVLSRSVCQQLIISDVIEHGRHICLSWNCSLAYLLVTVHPDCTALW